MVTNGNQYEERICSLSLRLADRGDQLDYVGRLPAGRSQRPEVVAVSKNDAEKSLGGNPVRKTTTVRAERWLLPSSMFPVFVDMVKINQ